MSITIAAGGLVVIDPSDKRVIQFDYDARPALATGAEIATSTWTLTAIRQLGTALTKDNESIVTGNRKTQLRLDATTATLGDRYFLANKIVTNETPPQTIERQITVVVQNQ